MLRTSLLIHPRFFPAKLVKIEIFKYNMSFPRIVLCTGANQGLGLAILQVAALHDPSPIYILACRNVASGNEALNQLRGEGIKAEIEVLQLDVTNDEHIISAIKFVESKYGKLDGMWHYQVASPLSLNPLKVVHTLSIRISQLY